MAGVGSVGWSCFIVCGLVFLLVPPAQGHADHDYEAPAPGVNLRATSLIVVKVSALVIVFVATLLGSMLPYLFRKSSSFLLLGTQFAGGVFLTTALMHFLSDSDVTFKILLPSMKYSITEMFVVAGYVITMLADVLVHRVFNRRAFQKLGNEDIEGAVEGPETKAAILATLNLFDAVLLILTLCFHSVFDGITIGVAGTEAGAWEKMWMVGIHKVVLALAMGILVLRLASNWPLLCSLFSGFAFAISTSVGVAIGIIINSTAEGGTADWIFAIWMGIATGVFLYVVVHHLLTKDHKLLHKNQPFFRWGAVLLGAVIVAIVLIWD